MSANNISSDTIKKLLKTIRHPAIDETLLSLGIIKDVRVRGNKVIVILAFPFPNIPIKEQLIESVKELLTKSKLKIDIEVKTTTMDKKELENFLTKEQENWKS